MDINDIIDSSKKTVSSDKSKCNGKDHQSATLQGNVAHVRRGRPKKTSITNVRSKILSDDDKKEDDIILMLPISTKDIRAHANDTTGQQNSFSEIINSFESGIIDKQDKQNEDKSDDNISLDELSANSLLVIIKEKDKKINQMEEMIEKMSRGINNRQFDLKQTTKIYTLSDPYEKNSDGTIKVPEHTHEACLWDTFEIGGMPYFLPDRMTDDKYFVIGWFCSLNCAIAYNFSLGDYKINERTSLLKCMYGKMGQTIHPSPSMRVLKKYGGMMTIEQYRENLLACDKEYRIILPPMTYISPTLEEKLFQKSVGDDVSQRRSSEYSPTKASKYKSKK